MGGKTSKPQGAHIPHDKKLAKLEKRMAQARTAEEFSELGLAFRHVGYLLGHDIPAMIAMPSLWERASRGKLRSNELEAETYFQIGDVGQAVYAMFKALEIYPDDDDFRVRMIARTAELLAPFCASLSVQLQAVLVDLPAEFLETCKEYGSRIQAIRDAIDWDTLPSRHSN